MTHAHVTTWFVAIILLFVCFFMQKNGKEKAAKITKMTLRLFYILILATGAHLFGVWATSLGADIITSSILLKAIFGLWVIVSMELIIVRQGKGQPTGIFWAQFIISFVLSAYWGWMMIG